MIRRRVLWVVSCLFVLAGCDKGLVPPEAQFFFLDFPIPLEGGDPVGVWSPDTTNPVEVTILDEEKIPAFVDSIRVDTQLDSAVFDFEVTGTCSVQAILSIRPTAYITGLPPISIDPIVDTLRGKGPYEVIEDQILDLPLQTSVFNLDTLGFSSRQNTLDLVSLPNTFPYEGFDDIPFYFVFHLSRSTGQTARIAENTFTPYRKMRSSP